MKIRGSVGLVYKEWMNWKISTSCLKEINESTWEFGCVMVEDAADTTPSGVQLFYLCLFRHAARFEITQSAEVMYHQAKHFHHVQLHLYIFSDDIF